MAQSNYATPYAFSTVVGAFSAGSANGPASVARFHEPSDVAIDAAGNIYVADTLNEVIRKIDPAGNVSTLAGAPGLAGTNDGTGSAARFHWPFGVAVDAEGNVYVADNGSNTIRKITPAGVVTTLAGSSAIQGSADGTGSAAQFHNPTYLALDGVGTVYVVDNDTAVRKITPSGLVTTLAGTSGVKGTADGAGDAASFTSLQGIAVDAAGNVFVGDSISGFDSSGSDLIRKISPGGQVTTLALTGANSPAETPLGFWVSGLALAPSGGLYVSSLKQDLIFAITPDGVVSQLAGKFINRLDGASTDGLGSAARFNQPGGITTDRAGNIYVADTGNNAIRKITSGAMVSTMAGLGWDAQIGNLDGTGSDARFGGSPLAIAVAPSGDVFVADFGNYTIRKFTPAGVVTTVAGLAGAAGHVDGQGPVARFDTMFGLTIDNAGNLYVPELTYDSHQNYSFYNIRKITADGMVTTLSPPPPVTIHWAPFWGRTNLVVDDAGNFYIPLGSTIVKLTPSGTTTTLAGSDTFAEGSSDGTGNAASFSSALSLAIDRSGNIYVADIGNETIRKVTPTGVVTTLAGLAGIAGQADGTGSGAQFNSPRGLAVDGSGNVYVADTTNQLIRKITPAGVVTTLAGLLGDQVTTDGFGREARFVEPESIAVDAKGVVYVTNTFAIRKGQLAGPPAIMTQPQSQTASPGMNVQFSVVANGAPEPTFQWFFNGNLLTGATGSALNLSNVRDTDAGSYSVVVANALGQFTSSAATLSVSAAPTTSNPAQSGGGGGSMGGWLVLALFALSALRGLVPRRPTPG
jgi:sugar lactone lactonase YvrE